MTEETRFLKGFNDGIPICLGYFSVSFAFGIFAVDNGLTVLQAVLISMLNLTSAGQFASVPIIGGGGTLIELALGQLIINLRYFFMSVSLSQKLGKSVKVYDRFLMSFSITDEIFAVAASNKSDVGRKYFYGLMTLPYIGWSMGTFFGAVMGSILPQSIVSALGVAIYAMFVGIVIPQMKSNKKIMYCVFFAMLLSCLFYFAPILNKIPSGFSVIICSVLASTIFAVFAPINETEEAKDEI